MGLEGGWMAVGQWRCEPGAGWVQGCSSAPAAEPDHPPKERSSSLSDSS